MATETTSSLPAHQVTDADLAVGTKVYYAGDQANAAASGFVVHVTRNPRFGDSYRLELVAEGGEKSLCEVGLSDFQPGHGRRFWLYDEWAADRRAKIARMAAELHVALGQEGGANA